MKLANYFIEKDKKIYSEKISNFYFLAFEPFFTDFFFAAIHLSKCRVQYISLIILVKNFDDFFLRNEVI
jgi:hypothetical protein